MTIKSRMEGGIKVFIRKKDFMELKERVEELEESEAEILTVEHGRKSVKWYVRMLCSKEKSNTKTELKNWYDPSRENKKKILIVFKVNAEQMAGNIEEFIDKKATQLMEKYEYAEIHIEVTY